MKFLHVLYYFSVFIQRRANFSWNVSLLSHKYFYGPWQICFTIKHGNRFTDPITKKSLKIPQYTVLITSDRLNHKKQWRSWQRYHLFFCLGQYRVLNRALPSNGSGKMNGPFAPCLARASACSFSVCPESR